MFCFYVDEPDESLKLRLNAVFKRYTGIDA